MNLHVEDQIDLARACQVLAAQPFSVMLGAKLLAIDLDHAEMAVPIGANVRQHDGIAHGGLIAARWRDGFLMSFWDRPELVLDPDARAATSGFATLSDDVQERVWATLGADLRSGEWDARYGELQTRSEFDSGLRLVLARG
jgi:hypothetical protein